MNTCSMRIGLELRVLTLCQQVYILSLSDDVISFIEIHHVFVCKHDETLYMNKSVQ